ncbi:hypothetical protein [Intestinibacter sp.]|uniref:hypothetical protein n=1 Tax=Intestinibacter sp. TaxID=1965304 RepID=UPI003F172D81
MINNQKITLCEKNKIRFEWKWNCNKGEMNVYLENLRNNDLEYLDKIVKRQDIQNKCDYQVYMRGIYRIVAFPVVNGVEDKAFSFNTNYIYIGTKNILEYCFGEESEFNCKYIYIKRLDSIILKEIAYIYSAKDDIKIPFTSDLKQGEKYYVADFEGVKIQLEEPYNLGVDIRLV